MRVLLIYGGPKKEGLAASCLKAANDGLSLAGADIDFAPLHEMDIKSCAVCFDGWGTCRSEHVCCLEDDLAALQQRVKDADAIVVQTPVYWGEVTETLKAFIDRIRRCEATKQDNVFQGKPVLLIASPGGTGNGLLSCLQQMERFVSHVRAQMFDFIGVNRWNREYKLKAIEAAAFALGSGKKPG